MSKRLLVHRCKFVDFVPSAVTSLAVSNYGYLAAARANGCVELYKIQPDHSLLLHDVRTKCVVLSRLAMSETTI